MFLVERNQYVYLSFVCKNDRDGLDYLLRLKSWLLVDFKPV